MEEVPKEPLFLVRKKIPFKEDLMFILEVIYNKRELRVFWTLSSTKRKWVCGVCQKTVPTGGSVYRPLNSKSGLGNARICVPCMAGLT